MMLIRINELIKMPKYIAMTSINLPKIVTVKISPYPMLSIFPTTVIQMVF
jgi:hypothetical protein